MINQIKTPLFDKLLEFSQNNPISFHVPGHKSGQVFPGKGQNVFSEILRIDLTELTGLDDLHAPTGVIKEAQQLAANWFQVNETFFLVGGSTVGNLAMILATCTKNDKVIVQRNCHKSIINGLELAGARPIFIYPDFDPLVNRYTGPNLASLKQAVIEHPDSKAVVLTYPDYYGTTFDLKSVVNHAHKYGIPVLVDEAHGIHFNVAQMFPQSAVELGADIVVQSTHKMATAMTMASYLHVNSNLVDRDKIANFLSMLQSSSPSYPLLASLDLARAYLATISQETIEEIKKSIIEVRDLLRKGKQWDLIPFREGLDDPLKITVQLKNGYDMGNVTRLLEENGLYYELASHNQILFIHGLHPYEQITKLEQTIENINSHLKFNRRNATIEGKIMFFSNEIGQLDLSYEQMNEKQTTFITWDEVDNHLAAEAVIPYPPGIPLLMKGEKVTTNHMELITELLKQGVSFQNTEIKKGLKVFL
ncbi:aminotransferase class I/II-fold pyridoxal phosphate-dependent enzyme [Aquibacillus salsiterrae]|uniref:Aminotransferase class I/II-fold pyridoxal phosphate-dependent enzyme n=1 Tax=Aquibacillus salsiterrae TaxID=2950439 RepID=A0A9X4AFI9_9BACI|nr:aminotransferase class I/II-fold pyridoxal phosphate-dependent enzyme [Aquibacillus salsiterrae]MDC3417956.1 aminotransferase class I/II-fold pyridoxal phosphate-dependent enzyme [Aquibacillus salsiterrae]